MIVRQERPYKFFDFSLFDTEIHLLFLVLSCSMSNPFLLDIQGPAGPVSVLWVYAPVGQKDYGSRSRLVTKASN
jgi:hypothetical protein